MPIEWRASIRKVGTLAALRVNCSYNEITELMDSPAIGGLGRSGGAEHGTCGDRWSALHAAPSG